MNELGAGISIGVLAALVVFVIYFIGAKIGRWQPRNPAVGPGAQGGYPQAQGGYGQNPYTQSGYGQSGYTQSGRPWSSEDETRVLPSSAQGYDDVDGETPRAKKNELAANIQHSGQMIEANRRAATAANGDTVAVFTYILGAALIAVVAFVFFNNLLLPATIGALTGAIICVALSATYTIKHLDFWPDNATISIINLLVALAASIFMYIGSVQTVRDNISLSTITDSFDALPFSDGFSAFAVAIGDRVVTFFKDFGFFGFVFLLFMGIGCIIVFTLAAKSLIDVMDWRIFAQFGHNVTDRPMSYSRAVRFQTNKVSHTVTSLVLAAIAVLAATGLLYDGFTWFTR
ncbi:MULTISPECIES: hypothetical protein [unclassified Brevibacterium]|uniref:hypothetical protein n=1 Tax=unclassified Brevibacterium TaxID=2614124 RepID=UPI0010922430|nr:hypothetical protein [Brevibacterium sp. S22]TGD31604.1 hypothetical protein EB835_07635 [Brevibacterium sp. S22]